MKTKKYKDGDFCEDCGHLNIVHGSNGCAVSVLKKMRLNIEMNHLDGLERKMKQDEISETKDCKCKRHSLPKKLPKLPKILNGSWE